MQRETLESALNEALKQRQARLQEKLEAAPEQSSCLLKALLHSATRMDKIVQRRIGLEQKPVLFLE